MGEKAVIFGGEKELQGAIREVEEKYHPDAIIVATSRASGIIGDCVDDVVNKARKEIQSEIMTIHCEGFAGEYRSGFDIVFRQIVDFMEPPTPERQSQLADAVNIVGAKIGPERTEVETDVKELVRLINGMGARVHSVIAGDCTLDELKQAPSAAVNCTLCLDLGYTIGKAMYDKFGTPLNSTILPYGISATEKWLKGAAKYLGMEAEANALMEREYAAIAEEFTAAKQHITGKLAIIEGHDAIKCLSIAHMLENDFGMRPVIYNFHPWSTEARETSVDYLLETGMTRNINH